MQPNFHRGLPSLSLSAPTAARCSLQSLLAARLGEITTSNIALYLSGDKGKCNVFILHACLLMSQISSPKYVNIKS